MLNILDHVFKSFLAYPRYTKSACFNWYPGLWQLFHMKLTPLCVHDFRCKSEMVSTIDQNRPSLINAWDIMKVSKRFGCWRHWSNRFVTLHYSGSGGGFAVWRHLSSTVFFPLSQLILVYFLPFHPFCSLARISIYASFFSGTWKRDRYVRYPPSFIVCMFFLLFILPGLTYYSSYY